MKRILLLSVIVSIAITLANSQTSSGTFKLRTKTSVHTPTSFKPSVINGQRKLKSASVNTSKINYGAGLTKFSLPNVDTEKKIIKGNDSITPIFIERKHTGLKAAKAQTPESRSYGFLKSIKQDMQITDPEKSFTVTDSKEDDLGHQHIRFSQRHKGVKVYNADFYVHFSPTHEIMNGRYFIVPRNINTIPEISAGKALQTVISDVKSFTSIKELTTDEKNLLHYEAPIIDTAIVKNEKFFLSYGLAYVITIRPDFINEWIYFVDAGNGSIIKKYNNTKFDGPATANAVDLNGVSRTINTYLEAGQYYMMDIAESMFDAAKGEGMIRTLNAQNTSTKNLTYVDVTSANNTWPSPTAVSAHYNATQTYKYFKNTFNRNSINGQGGNIISLINVADEDGQSMENAFWNGAAIFYGNGGTYFNPLAGALDVAAHEIGHGVTGNTAALEYQGESGAMNEAFSDIFGAMVDRANWYIGESVTKTSYITTGRLRDMSNPHNDGANGWQPKHVSEMYKGADDNGGVHSNSGIINHAFYLYATAVTKEKAEQVFYRALTNYLTKSSQFLDMRIAAIQSAKDLYTDGSNEVNQAKIAFDAVGIYEEQQVTGTQTYTVNPGQDYLLMDNTDAADVNSLYRSSVTGTNFFPLSTTKMKRRASVVDNGSYAVFVSTDSKLRSIALNPSNPVETIISNDAFWDNVAISKDGNRLAAISNEIDTSIYVYDFVSAKWSRFILYNPTTQDSVKSTGVLYADAVEFDNSGEYLIYDAYNRINSSAGADINYWDIGIIKVWDTNLNKFGDGSISKLYGSLPDSISIGNPTFSKNSPNIISFDYLDESSIEYAVLGLNLETMDLGLIANNNTIGFPSFSKLDDKVAFTALDGARFVINVSTLGSDKISSSAFPVTVVLDAQWPVYYATGTRVLGLTPLANFAASYKTGSAPFIVKFMDNSRYDPTSWLWTFEGGNPASSTLQNPSVTYNSLGNYAVTLKATNSYGFNTIVKTGYIVVTAINDLPESKKSFRVYPNPVKDILYIQQSANSTKNASILIYSTDGKLVKSLEYQESIDLTNLKSGIYIVKIVAGTEIVQIKIIKE